MERGGDNMAVYFSAPLVQLFDKKLRVAGTNCGLLRVEERVQESIFFGWRPDLSIDTMAPDGPMLVRKESDEIALVLVGKYRESGFGRDLMVVPDKQFVHCVRFEKRIVDDASQLFDAVIVIANPGDIFCVTDGECDVFYIACKDQVLRCRRLGNQSFRNVLNSYGLFYDDRLDDYLTDEGFGFSRWRELMPDFR